MPSTNLNGKSKADLVVLAELSGLLTAANARKLTKAKLIEFLNESEQKSKTAPNEEPAKTRTPRVRVRKTADDTAEAKIEAVKTREKVAETNAKSNEPAAKTSKQQSEPTESEVKPTQTETKKASAVTRRARAGAKTTAAKPKTNTLEDKKTEADPAPSAETEKNKAAEPKRSRAKTKTTETKKSTSRVKTDPASLKEVDAKTQTEAASEKAAAGDSDNEKQDVQPRKSTRGRKKTIKPAPVSADTDNADNKAAVEIDTNSKDLAKSQSEGNRKGDAGDVSLTSANSAGIDSKPAAADTVQKTADQTERQIQQDHEHKRNDQQNHNNQRQFAQQNQSGQKNAAQINKQKRPIVEQGEPVSGTLEIMSDGYGFLRKDNYLQGTKDIYVPPQYIRRFSLRTGDFVTGPAKLQRENDRYQALLYVKEVNGTSPDKMIRRPQFDRLTPIYPDERYRLETTRNELSTRIIDLAAPIGKGQRGMIVSPPKAGKTILLQKIANAISVNNPEVKLIVLLIDERPEEVTDMQRSIKGEVVYSTFDKTPENHVKVTELVLERAMRLVELKQDVVILLDSMTRLARAYNLTINPTGRTLSGGLDPGALYGPKRFFGAARNIENGGSLTIIATSLIETGSRMDEVIFEEFKGTGNMEVYLDRKLSEKRIFPAIDINRSGTRREELLMTEKELDAVWSIRKAFSQLDTAAVTETIINLLLKTQNNEHFISSINVSFNDKSIFDAMRGNRPTGNGQQNQNTMNNGQVR